MDAKQLRARAQKSRDQATREKLLLIEAALESRRQQCEDKMSARIRTAHEELEKLTRQAAGRGQDGLVLVRLSSQLYDLRQAVLEELSSSVQRENDPYPTLRKQGPFAFKDVDNWLTQELGWRDPQHTSPLPWLDQLAQWVLDRRTKGVVGRLLQGGPPLQEPLAGLYRACKAGKLKAHFELYQGFEDKGVALKVTW